MREQSHPCTGFDVKSRMTRAVPVLRQAIKKLALKPGEKLIFQLGCDASPIPAMPEYDELTDTITGTCGPLGHQKCSLQQPVTVGDGEEGYNNIVKMVLEQEWASYLYICVLQPLADHVPNQTVLIYPTCNRFDHEPHLEHFWKLIFDLFYEILVLKAGLPVMLEGKGADGDSRERCCSMQRMYLRYMSRSHPRRSTFGELTDNFLHWHGLVGATGFRLFGVNHLLRLRNNGQTKTVEVVSGVDSSDPHHCDKKIDRKGQDKSGTHVIGGYEVLHAHLLTVMNLERSVESIRKAAAGNCARSGVQRSDLVGQDPQNLAACTRRCGFMMLRALIAMQPVGPACMRGPDPAKMNRRCLPNVNTDPTTIPVLDAVLRGSHDLPWVCDGDDNLPELQTQGTVAYYSMAAAHTLIHNSRSWGLAQRVRFAGFVTCFLRVGDSG